MRFIIDMVRVRLCKIDAVIAFENFTMLSIHSVYVKTIGDQDMKIQLLLKLIKENPELTDDEIQALLKFDIIDKLLHAHKSLLIVKLFDREFYVQSGKFLRSKID